MRSKPKRSDFENNCNSSNRSNHFYNQSLTTGLQTTGNDGGQRNNYRGRGTNRGQGNRNFRRDPNENGYYDGRYHHRSGQSHYGNRQSEHYDDRGFPKFRGTHEEQISQDVAKELSHRIDVEVPTPSPSRSKELSVPTETKAKIKSEKVTPPPSDDSADNSTSSEKDEPKKPVKSKNKEKAKPIQEIQSVKAEVKPLAEPNKAVKKTPVAPVKTPLPSNQSSTSSEDSSSSEEEIPQMPKPIKTTESLKLKKERTVEDEVVCLGKPNNIEDLLDDEERTCLLCNTPGHSSVKCKMKCRKCSQSSYKTQIICQNCGETYPKTKTLPTPIAAPNPFIMFMQFMQFCMQQYSDFSTDMFQPVPGPPLVQSSAQGVEVTRQDIADTKRNRRKIKSESKHSRKRRQAENTSDSDSDSSSRATTSIRKRKKQETVQPAKASQSTQQQEMPPFTGFLPGSVPFPGGFSAPGYNPMLAFTQMMGYNPATMNFPR